MYIDKKIGVIITIIFFVLSYIYSPFSWAENTAPNADEVRLYEPMLLLETTNNDQNLAIEALGARKLNDKQYKIILSLIDKRTASEKNQAPIQLTGKYLVSFSEGTNESTAKIISRTQDCYDHGCLITLIVEPKEMRLFDSCMIRLHYLENQNIYYIEAQERIHDLKLQLNKTINSANLQEYQLALKNKDGEDVPIKSINFPTVSTIDNLNCIKLADLPFNEDNQDHSNFFKFHSRSNRLRLKNCHELVIIEYDESGKSKKLLTVIEVYQGENQSNSWYETIKTYVYGGIATISLEKLGSYLYNKYYSGKKTAIDNDEIGQSNPPPSYSHSSDSRSSFPSGSSTHSGSFPSITSSAASSSSSQSIIMPTTGSVQLILPMPTTHSDASGSLSTTSMGSFEPVINQAPQNASSSQMVTTEITLSPLPASFFQELPNMEDNTTNFETTSESSPAIQAPNTSSNNLVNPWQRTNKRLLGPHRLTRGNPTSSSSITTTTSSSLASNSLQQSPATQATSSSSAISANSQTNQTTQVIPQTPMTTSRITATTSSGLASNPLQQSPATQATSSNRVGSSINWEALRSTTGNFNDTSISTISSSASITTSSSINQLVTNKPAQGNFTPLKVEQTPIFSRINPEPEKPEFPKRAANIKRVEKKIERYKQSKDSYIPDNKKYKPDDDGPSSNQIELNPINQDKK